jgi:V8-like Glu-specific endopeptidase
MWKEEFAEIRELVAAGNIEPAILKARNIATAIEINVGSALVNVSLLLSARFYKQLVDDITGRQSAEEAGKELNRLAADLLSYLSLLERGVTSVVPPARRLSLPEESAKTSELHLKSGLAREALIKGSQFRTIAWFEEALVAAKSVCKIQSNTSVATGFIVGGGKVVTNNHVLPTEKSASEAILICNYQEGCDRTTSQYALDPEKLFLTDADLDCTIVAIKGTQEDLARWGRLGISVSDIQVGSAVSVIQHPEGGYKRVASLGNILVGKDGRVILYATSTMPGSSGAPVFDDNWKVVALHQGAGIWSKDEGCYTHNQGIRFSAIVQSPNFSAALVGP